VPRRLVETRTAVCNPSTRFGKATLSFIDHNYLRVGQLAVAGKMITPSPDGRIEFDVVIPQRYTFVGPEGAMTGGLDGTPLQSDRELPAGRHEFVPDRPTKQVALLWARAWQKGYSPFRQAKRSYAAWSATRSRAMLLPGSLRCREFSRRQRREIRKSA
jgi:hypothetical protein